ncbi:substrate-binding domain-containing protein [Burkholderia sp. 22PA0099]|uniref:substrate-binding domain-containing protein n=1 Tax=Burkholderia sp. 22PA0099 TaxID=3237372 RepID=UPI0039C4774C
MSIERVGSAPLTLISSMATRQLLARLAAAYAADTGREVAIESVGGVEAARRVSEGEAFDVVVLAGDALARLAEAGQVDGGSRVAIARSGIAVAVRSGAPLPAIDSEAALREAVMQARTIGYSTGPSGTHLEALFARWGVADALAPRLVRARPGVPVASLVAAGEVELGFQQRSELLDQPGIAIVGALPDAAQAVTTFTGAIGARCARRDEAAAWLAFLAAPAAVDIKQSCGMDAAA